MIFKITSNPNNAMILQNKIVSLTRKLMGGTNLAILKWLVDQFMKGIL